MTLLDIPDDYIALACDDKITYDFNLTVFTGEDKVKLAVDGVETSWMSLNDSFIDRIRFGKLNPCFLERHLLKEIEIRNTLDMAMDFLKNESHQKAIECLDEVLYYDFQYGQALILKSRVLFGQGHFVKSLRHYRKAVRADSGLKDVEYHKLLLKKSSKERDNFPKIKRDIYAGDEHFAKGEFEMALESYERALANPTKFKTKILSKLLNKKATTLVKLDRIDEAIAAFEESVGVKANDYAYFNLGILDYDLHFDTFRRHLQITKRQLLQKAEKLNECGEAELALDCLDEFFDNHYKVDDDYECALNLKLDILKDLGRDTNAVESVLKYVKLFR